MVGTTENAFVFLSLW